MKRKRFYCFFEILIKIWFSSEAFVNIFIWLVLNSIKINQSLKTNPYLLMGIIILIYDGQFSKAVWPLIVAIEKRM
jgi:hypothetical protein